MQSSLFFESLFKRPAGDGAAEFIKQLAAEHPYFSPAQFYVLQQTDINSEAYIQQAAKTSALFNNPYWLNFQLLRMQQQAEIIEPVAAIEETPIQQPIEATETINAVEEEQYTQHPIATIETGIVAEENIQQPVVRLNSEATEDVAVEDENHPVIERAGMEQNIAKTLEEKIPIIQYATNVEEKLLFEPLFARDYFASQGIKLSEEIQANDKLGKQLKSFTDWLKTMKKIAPDRMQIDHTQQNDSTIQTLAEKSNNEGETLTETMADIFMQQGKADKAIETYQKLSLLNPHKSAYFAGKIEQLKEH